MVRSRPREMENFAVRKKRNPICNCVCLINACSNNLRVVSTICPSERGPINPKSTSPQTFKSELKKFNLV